MNSGKTFTLPTILTLLRLALLPVVVVLFYLPFDWVRPACAIVFAIAGITDWLDGYLARRLNQTSPFGAFLDPVADKVLVAASLILLVADDPRVWVTLPAMVIIGREIIVSALREWMAEIGSSARVAVSMLGKIIRGMDVLAALPTFINWVLLVVVATAVGVVVYLFVEKPALTTARRLLIRPAA